LTLDDLGRRLGESRERGKEEGVKLRRALNASFERINEFDRQYKER